MPWFFVGLFLLFVFAFLIAPTLVLVVQTFIGDNGFTLSYLTGLWDYQYRVAFENSIILGLASAFVGVIGGGFLAYSTLQPGAPPLLRSVVTSFSAVATNFAGVPLAFAFISTLRQPRAGDGRAQASRHQHLCLGLLALFVDGADGHLRLFPDTADAHHHHPRDRGVACAMARGIGWAGRQQLPVLAADRAADPAPSLLGGFLLLFGSAFSAFATPYALTDGNIALVTINIGNVLSGNVMSDPQVGAALSTGMILVMAIVLVIYSLTARYAARWRR